MNRAGSISQGEGELRVALKMRPLMATLPP